MNEEKDSQENNEKTKNEEEEQATVSGKNESSPDQLNTTKNLAHKSNNQEEQEIEIMDLSADVVKYADIDLDDDEQLREMLKDFSDIEDLSIEEMMEIQNAIEDVKEVADEAEYSPEIEKMESEGEEIEFDPYEGWGLYEEIKSEFKPEITEDLETLIQEELEKKREKKKIITPEAFAQYCSDRRTKIWYHALWVLVFDIEDHQASKDILYELLKEATSKSPIDPIEEHKFYFGLGFILRLTLNGKKVIEFRGDKLKLDVGIDVLNDILHEVGKPISERPILTKSEKKKMYLDFLTDDFKDI
ncbi:MAG: hypothetical protein JW776_07990 [Candidatus Lokiarchaeota archaeon]|nr:hypothetical protein [Candidatus Lokiarchaeota archaeon]